MSEFRLSTDLPTRSDIDDLLITKIDQGDFSLLEARGLLCPEPVMLLHKLVKQLNGGDVIKVCADDESTLRDIPRFCEFLKHKLLAVEQTADGERSVLVFWIEKRS